MTDDYTYSGECEPTLCPCGATHPWEYELEKSANGQTGCYVCLSKCEFCDDKFFEVFMCDGFSLCAGCMAVWRDEKEEDVVVELAA